MPGPGRPGYHPSKQPHTTMPVDPQLRALDIEIPTQPEVLVKLSLLMADEDIDLQAVSALVETDMALAAAVLKAVNSSLYGLRGRVQTVHQALTYLGMREVAAITFEMGLRAAFPPAAELEPVWARAAKRGLLMGRMGQMLGVDPWAAHSAGLFEECGKAVLYRHAPAHYPAMLRAAAKNYASVTVMCDLADYEPVLAEAPPEHPLWKHEMFLPITMVMAVDSLDEEPRVAAFFDRLASFSRMVRIDPRGVGLSDPIADEITYPDIARQ